MALLVLALAIAACRQPATARAHTDCCAARPKILVLRGIFEVFSLGMNELSQKLVDCGYDAQVTSWSLALYEAKCTGDRPYVIIGHSLGGRMCAWVSRKLGSYGYRVPLIIIVDANLIQPIPANVDKCLHLHVTNPLGIFHGHPVRGESPHTQIINWDVSRGQPSWYEGGVNHFDIDATPWVHQIIINEIATAFPLPRASRVPHPTARGPMTELGARSDRTWPALENAPPWRPPSQAPSNSFEAPPFVPRQAERPSMPVWRPDRPKPPLRSGTSP